MGRNSNSGLETNSELRILLVVTVVIGLLLMLSLLMCYACVLKRLCCGTPRERAKNLACARRTESYPMGDITLLSQPTESERRRIHPRKEANENANSEGPTKDFGTIFSNDYIVIGP